MFIDPNDRIAPIRKSARSIPPFLALSLLLGVSVLAILAVPGWRESAQRTALDAGAVFGLQSSQDRFGPLYERLGVTVLPAQVFTSSKVSASLDQLAREPCDRTAIFALGQALVAEHQERTAAQANFGFAMSCPNSQAEEMRSAQMFLTLGDLEKAIRLADDLATKNPATADYRYLRGKALASAGRNLEAVADYKSTIELTKNPREIGEWVFTEIAKIFMALGQPALRRRGDNFRVDRNRSGDAQHAAGKKAARRILGAWLHAPQRRASRQRSLTSGIGAFSGPPRAAYKTRKTRLGM